MSKKRGNGEGSITKRKDGRWMARYTVHTAKGPKRRTVYGRTRRKRRTNSPRRWRIGTAGIVFDLVA